MKRALFSVVAAALLLSACTGSDAVDQNGVNTFEFHGATKLGQLIPESQRKPAHNFEGELLDGRPFTLASTKGKAVVLNFWGSWCGPCRTELPQFDLLYRKLKTRGAAFVGINTRDPKSNAQSFVKNNDVTFPSVFDEPGRVPLRLGHLPAIALPFTVLLDRQGRVAAVYALALSYKDLQPPLERLLTER